MQNVAMSSPSKSSCVSYLRNAPNRSIDSEVSSATASISRTVLSLSSPQPRVHHDYSRSPTHNNSNGRNSLSGIVSPDRRESALCFFYANRIVALDCEMVGVGPGGQRSALARVSLVDFFGNCILDTFVQVDEHVTDYRTKISGVEAHDLTSPRAMSFDACRQLVTDIVRNKTLVGHGLENDLKVLGIAHPWYSTRDTAFYGPYMRVDSYGGRQMSRRLKDLAETYLGIFIQQTGSSHSSMEDACAAMALYRRVQGEWDCEMDFRRRNAVLRTRLHDVLRVC